MNGFIILLYKLSYLLLIMPFSFSWVPKFHKHNLCEIWWQKENLVSFPASPVPVIGNTIELSVQLTRQTTNHISTALTAWKWFRSAWTDWELGENRWKQMVLHQHVSHCSFMVCLSSRSWICYWRSEPLWGCFNEVPCMAWSWFLVEILLPQPTQSASVALNAVNALNTWTSKYI